MNSYELFDAIIKLTNKLNIIYSLKVREWDKAIGINPKVNPEEFIKRAIIACSQQFNFREGNIIGLNAETIMKWVRDGYKREELIKLNLVADRLKLYDDCFYFLNSTSKRIGSFKKGINYWIFWKFISSVYGNDPVNKRVNLLRMILKDSGFEISNKNKPNIVIDYNILAVLKYLKVINYKGDFQDTKAEVNELRKKTYNIIRNLIIKNNKKDTYIDGLLFCLGRELRKRNLINVCLYKGCTDY